MDSLDPSMYDTSPDEISLRSSFTQKQTRPSLTLRDSIFRILKDNREQCRLIPRTRGRINVRSNTFPRCTEYMFFLICDLPWLQLFAVTTGMLLVFILVFAIFFYFIGGISIEHLDEEYLSLWTSFCFTFQTMDQIGYGLLSPVSFSCDIAATLTSLMANFFWKFSAGLIAIKMSLPKKLKHLNKFSKIAVRNRNQLIFRIAGTFSASSLCNGKFQLIYFKCRTDAMGYEIYEFTECDFEINYQHGRNRDLGFSRPLLRLPWTVTHPINKNSPLYGLSLNQMQEENGEIIGILVGSDEVSSLWYQTRWSFKANEILEGREFIPCVHRDQQNGVFNVDFDRLSKTKSVEPSISPKDWIKVQNAALKGVQRSLRRTFSLPKRQLTRALLMSPVCSNSLSCDSSPTRGIKYISKNFKMKPLIKKKHKVNETGDPHSPLRNHFRASVYSSSRSKSQSECCYQEKENDKSLSHSPFGRSKHPGGLGKRMISREASLRLENTIINKNV